MAVSEDLQEFIKIRFNDMLFIQRSNKKTKQTLKI